ncbi:MAG: DUF2169 domain-containing protein, partial [Deltaproteobacteria bacterium]|nr:DUF2169 domain-containing protein [Deltaproteobacteria bacterium]
MKIIKSNQLALLFTSFMSREKLGISIAALAYFHLDPPETVAKPMDRLLEEAKMWPAVAAALGDEEALDLGIPKKHGEFLVYGSAYAKPPRSAILVRIMVGEQSKILYVSGPRSWNITGISSRPALFSAMRISWTNAFGGADWEANPLGKGMAPGPDGRISIPTIQDPTNLVTSPDDRPGPAGLTAYPSFWPQRRRYLGKFDETWLENRWPHYPLDTNPEYFNTAPKDQRLNGFFQGAEAIRIVNMHPSQREIISPLPDIRARLFINRLLEGKEVFAEVESNAETLW